MAGPARRAVARTVTTADSDTCDQRRPPGLQGGRLSSSRPRRVAPAPSRADNGQRPSRRARRGRIATGNTRAEQGETMTEQPTRRTILKGSLAAAGLGVLGIPDWALPALAQSETLVPFTDMPANLAGRGRRPAHQLDIRTIDGPFTPKRQVLHHPALRPSRGGPGRLPAEGVGPGAAAAGALARRAEEDEERRAHRRLRVLGQPASAAGALEQRTLDRRAAQDGARSRRREAERAGSSSSSAPTTARRKSSSARRSSSSISSSAAACRARRRSRPSRCWCTR